MTDSNQTPDPADWAEDGLDCWAMAGFWTKYGGINRKTLLDREVLSRERPDRYLEFNIADGISKVADLWAKNFNNDPKLQKRTEELKREKSFQEVRKLEIENQIRSGAVVRTEDVQTQIGQAARSIMDKLDAISMRVKMQVPDIPQAQLAIIQDCIIDRRNALADERRSDVVQS